MNVGSLLGPEILDIATAIGLVTGTGDINDSWFKNPLTNGLDKILTNPAQLAALLDLFDQILPPQAPPGAPAGEKWHPLLGTQANGNFYLTVSGTGPVVIGLAGAYNALASPAVTVLARLPAASISSSAFTPIAGTANGPLSLDVSVTLNWTTPANPITLAGIQASLILAPLATSPAPTASIELTLAGLDLDGKGAADRVLTPSDFGSDAVQLLLGLIHAELLQLEALATGELKALAQHLPPLLGLDGSIPIFPFTTLASDPKALTGWLTQLITGTPAPISTWLVHLAGLLGSSLPVVTVGNSWSVPLIAFNTSSSANLTFTSSKAADGVTPLLGIGVDLSLLPGATPPARVDASIVLFNLPLAGSVAPVAFPSASVTVTAPGVTGQQLIAPGGSFSIDTLRAGLAWNGSSLSPLLQLTNVVLPGASPYPVIDLTNINTVVAAASSAAAGEIQSALGSTGAGAHIAALASLIEPSSDPTAPLIDLAQLVSHPTSAIASLQRQALLSTTHPWSIYLTEIAGLLGLTGAIAGSGTPSQPWTWSIATSGPLSVQLAAWNAQTSGNASDPQLLRIALQLAAASASAQATWATELLSADLPTTGTNDVRLLGGHHATVSITPGTISPVGGIGLAATSMTAALDIVPGSPISFKVSVNGLAVTTPQGTANIAALQFPFPAGFDITNPASLGISVTQLEQLVLAFLVGELSSAFGSLGLATSVLFGAAAGAPGLPSDFPPLADPAGPGSLFTNPLAAVQTWIGKVATQLSSNGSSFFTAFIPWLEAWLSNQLPANLTTPPNVPSLEGQGTYEDPWVLPLGTAGPASGLLWLEPEGPPSAAPLAAAAVTAATSFDTLATALTGAARYLGATAPAGLSAGLTSLSTYLTSSDGVVPVTSQVPTGGTWTSGTAIGSAHNLQAADPSAITQILAQVDAWAAPGSNRAILLLGPAFLDHTEWSALLAQAESAHAGSTNAAATFNLRVSGVAPASIDLRPVATIADYYTADLQDDGSGDIAGLSAQIGLLTARILALKPNAAILLVAHSTAGVPARAYTESNATQVKGLITLGTPHLGAPLTPLTDTPTAEALRAIGTLLPNGLAAGPLTDALTHLRHALDGYLPPATAGALPVPYPYPYGDFAGSADTTTGGVPALALGGPLAGAAGVNLLSAMQAAASTAITGFTATAPTHLAFGAKMALPLGADTDVSAQASMRLDAGRLALQTAAPDPPHPAHALSVDIAISRPGGWLAGGTLSFADLGTSLVDVRVRSAEFGAVFTLNGTTLSAAPYAQLTDAAFHGTTLPQVNWNDPQLAASLGSVFTGIAATAPAVGSSLATLLGALEALGICAATASGGIGIAADAITALTADPLSFLSANASTALSAASIPGFTAISGGFSYTPASLPFELFVLTSPATVGISTTAGAGLSLGTNAALNFSIALPLATMQPNISAGLQLGPVTLTYSAGTLTLAVPPALSSLQLYPVPPSATILAALESALPWLLVEVAGNAVLSTLSGEAATIAQMLSFMLSPGGSIVSTSAFGDGTYLDPAKINQLLSQIGTLPGGLAVAATGKNPTAISLTTTAPIGGVLALSLGLTIDKTLHPAPQGSFTLQAPLSGTWPNVGITFGVDPSGISLSLQPGGAAAIELLPTFSGSAAFASAAKTLLPAALDGLVGALPAANPLVKLTLDIAAALNIYDTAGGFANHATQLAAMLSSTWFSTLSSTIRTAFLNAASSYFNDATSPLKGLLPGAIAVSGSALSWTLPVPSGVGSGTLSLLAGWDGSGPTLALSTNTVTLTNAPFSVTASAGFASGNLQLDVGIDISLSGLGIAIAPELDLALTGGNASLTLLPLGSGTSSTLSLQLLPTPKFTASADAAVQIAENWGFPLVADLLITATGTQFGQQLGSTGKTIESILSTAQLINIGAGPAPGRYTLKTPLPSIPQIISNVASALSPVTIPIVTTPPLSLTFSNAGNKLGVGLLGEINISTGSPTISLLFGAPADWLGPSAGITLDLFNTGSTITFAPALTVQGLGIGFAGDGDSPLFNLSGFSMGAVDAYIAFTLDLLSGAFNLVGGGLEIDKLGLPLNLLNATGSSNPVAASLFDTSGGSGQGDTTPANPSVDVVAYSLGGPFVLEFEGTSQPIVIPVHASFGPIYIDQLDLSLPGGNSVEIGVDGSAKINGLDVGVDELALTIPVPTLTTITTWSLDLEGLAVGFEAGVVEISGGLRKNPGPPIEYDGMLSVTIADIGLTIVGAYSQPSDAQGSYTSLFMFISLPLPLGGPPFAFVMGLGGGFGYNRELNVPTDLDNIDSFLLVSAIDDDSLANDPMGALMQMSTSIPPRRGAFWLAAGVRFTTFGLINSIVVVAVALDRGFEIDVLGISRMALPDEDTALISVELALKATYSSEQGMLSIQAQLTDNSYLFTRDCQLTGGFAFFIWFTDGQFVLTLGGYNPVFTKPPEFPDVPRLGFYFSVSSIIVVKGGAYFALTNSCVMAGGSLNATASIGPVSAWLIAYIDILISWDPFTYEFDVGVEIGVSVSVRICFFGCVTIGVTISVGASLQIEGPPFHGTATLDAYVTTITIAFGDPPQQPDYIQLWSLFASKYLTAGDPNGNAISLQFTNGVLVPDPPGAQPQPGTQAQPWLVGVEFTFQSTTRMPTTSTQDFAKFTTLTAAPDMPVIDLAPMYILNVAAAHTIALAQQADDGSWGAPTLNDPADHFTVTLVDGYFPEATWHWVDPHNVPAGARTITAVAGISIDGHVVFNNQSALIPISTLVADLAAFALPLPFAYTPPLNPIMQAYGAQAASLAASIANATSQQMITASGAILAGNNLFSQNRTAFNLPPAGIDPLSTLSLQRARSAPPLVSPITTGLTMNPVGLAAPTLAETIVPVSSVLLTQPRLRAVMQRPAPPVADTPVVLHTTVTKQTGTSTSVSSIPRMSPPATVTLAGARLVRVPSATAPRPTRASTVARALRNSSGGTVIPAAHQQALDAAATALVSSGVVLAGGATHVWQLSQDSGSFTITGTSAVRVAFAQRNGSVISDTDYVVTKTLTVTVPQGAALAAMESLGNIPAGVAVPAPAFAAVTSMFAPAQQQTAVGWQATSTLLQVGPTEFLARGAAVSVPRIYGNRRLGQRASYGTAVAANVILSQNGIETQLPKNISVIMIALDLANAAIASSDDGLAIGVVGATLASTPQRVSSANRRLLLYDIASLDATEDSISVSVASTGAWNVAGVIGVHGSAIEWATQLAAGIPNQFVPDGPLTPDGSLTIQFTPPAAKGSA